MYKYQRQKNTFINYIKSYNSFLNNTLKSSKGFTILEAIIAIFILTISISSMLGLTANSATSARYANNEITGNYLLQEAVDSIRNSRDTMAFQQKKESGKGWDKFLERYGYTSGNNDKCFHDNGCYLKINSFNPKGDNNNDVLKCNQTDGSCPYLNYDSDANNQLFYTYDTSSSVSRFNRIVKMSIVGGDKNQIKVEVLVKYSNGGMGSVRTLSLVTYLLNWQKE